MKQLLFLIVLCSSIAVSQPRWMDHDKDPDKNFGNGFNKGKAQGKHELIEQLNLSDDQIDKFRVIHSEFQKKQIELRAKIQTMRISLRDLFQDDKPDQDKIEAQIGEISKTQNEIKLSDVNFWFKVNKILTPDQQKTWKEHREVMTKKMFERGHEGMKHKKGMMDRSPMMRERMMRHPGMGW